MEMTGLDPETCVVMEIATIVTDAQLNILILAMVFPAQFESGAGYANELDDTLGEPVICALADEIPYIIENGHEEIATTVTALQ